MAAMVFRYNDLSSTPQISVYQFSNGLNDFGSELADWDKAVFNLSNVSQVFQVQVFFMTIL